MMLCGQEGKKSVVAGLNTGVIQEETPLEVSKHSHIQPNLDVH